jgi:hypothetical protein
MIIHCKGIKPLDKDGFQPKDCWNNCKDQNDGKGCPFEYDMMCCTIGQEIQSNRVIIITIESEDK